MDIIGKIAAELGVRAIQVSNTIKLLDEGSTVPFIARYRKEVTEGLNDIQLRQLEERLNYLRELQERKQVILNSINEQGKLTEELAQKITGTDNKATLEDLYLPYKPKRRTKAQIAREAGLEPLAEQLLAKVNINPEELANTFLNPELQITNTQQALEGAQAILLERFSEDAALLGELRNYLWENAILSSEVIKGKEISAEKFLDYFAYQEPLHKIPSHRALAIFRGQREECLQVRLAYEPAEEYAFNSICRTFNININLYQFSWLNNTIKLTWKIKLFLKLEVELLMQLRENAELEAIKVFAENLRQLLMAAPAGMRVTMGMDPGLRTGVKIVVISETGKVLASTTIFPHAPKNDWDNSLHMLAKLCAEFKVELLSIGNGTASRETDKLVSEVIKKNPQLNLTKVIISEAGASVYSASEIASKEFPDLDVSYRGAVSIARRLQDPLAELIKIDPKSIGVGQYQHDVNQIKLSKSLQNILEDCVNAVGVELNTASVPLLTAVAGLSESLAKLIVAYRDQNGPFSTREQLKQIPRLGPKTFEQAAGFLRIHNSENPLDCSAVHPEAYPLVETILASEKKSIREILGKSELLYQIKPEKFVNDRFGLPTIKDILKELEKPGRDPRPEFKTANLREDVETMNDLKVGMQLEGTITNVANFGAFVDIGVHQDGLVHVSELTDRFIKDPKEVVKVGDIVKVRVVEIDINRKRISLSMRSPRQTDNNPSKNEIPVGKKVNIKSPLKQQAMPINNPFAEILGQKNWK